MSATLIDRSSLAASSASADTSAALRWSGRIATTIVLLFLVFDFVIKVTASDAAVKATVEMGFAASQLLPIALIEVVCLVLYLVPRTAPLGAVLWTGYLGGAIATHLRLGNPLFTHVLFPIYVAILLWGGLYARDPRVRALIKPRR
jgi:hypothetical protein